MASTATTRNRLNKQGTGDNTGTWGTVLNEQGLDMLDEALDGVTTLTISGNVTLTSQNYVSDQSRRRILKLTGSPGASYIITIPSVEKFYFVINQSNAAQTIKAGGVGYSVPAGSARPVVCDGTDCFGPDASMPTAVGVVADYAGIIEPSGWLFCYGQAISRSTYAALFGAIGTTYGVGNGTTTFNLPDCRGRVVAGQDDMGGVSADRLTSALNGDTLGATSGGETHTLTIAQLPSHSHGGAVTGAGGHEHNYVTATELYSVAAGGSTNVVRQAVGAVTSGGGGHVHGIAAEGGGSAHNITQPTIIMNKIIYAGV